MAGPELDLPFDYGEKPPNEKTSMNKVHNYIYKKRLMLKKFKILILTLGTLLFFQGCKTQYVPITGSTSTTVNVKDSTVFNIKDSVRIIERSRYKDYGDLLKVIRIDGNRSHMTAWVDTTKNILNGELVEDPVQEKTHIEYRDRIEYKDSVRVEIKPEPYPVEIEKKVKYIPWYNQVLSAIGLISLLTALAILGIKFIKLK